MPALTNKQKARNTNVALFGRSEHSDSAKMLAKYAKPVPPKHRDMGVILANCDAWLEEQTGKQLRKVSASIVTVFKKLLEIATRDPIENINVQCECGENIEVPVPSAQLEKNQITALNKLADKFAPNLAAHSTNVDVNVYINTIPQIISRALLIYVPADKQMECMAMVNKEIGEIGNAKSY